MKANLITGTARVLQRSSSTKLQAFRSLLNILVVSSYPSNPCLHPTNALYRPRRALNGYACYYIPSCMRVLKLAEVFWMRWPISR